MAASRPRRTFAHIRHSRPRRAYRARSSLPRRVPSSPDRGGRRSPRARASYSTSCPRMQLTVRSFAPTLPAGGGDQSRLLHRARVPRPRRAVVGHALEDGQRRRHVNLGAGRRHFVLRAASSCTRAAEHGSMHVPRLLARRPHGGAALRQRLRQLAERRHEAPRSLRLALRFLRLAPRRLPRGLRAVAGPPPRGHVWTSGQAADVCESYRPRGRDSMLSM